MNSLFAADLAEPENTSVHSRLADITWSLLADFDSMLADPAYEFSLEKGFLMASHASRQAHSIRSLNITLSPQASCLAPSWLGPLLEHLVGYDTIITSNLLHVFRGRGYVLNVRSKELLNLNYGPMSLSRSDWQDVVGFKLGVLLMSLFLLVTTCTLVSFCLRETQLRILRFTEHLAEHVRLGRPIAPLVASYVVDSLVFVPIVIGVMFFLFEFLNDQLLAFLLMALVWSSEVFAIVSIRTAVGQRLFPVLVYLYLTLFHIYLFHFPYAFTYFAFAALAAVVVASASYLWSCHEVPALLAGRLTLTRPRALPATLHPPSPPQSRPHPSPPLAAAVEDVEHQDEQRQDLEQEHLISTDAYAALIDAY